MEAPQAFTSCLGQGWRLKVVYCGSALYLEVRERLNRIFSSHLSDRTLNNELKSQFGNCLVLYRVL